MRLTPLSIKGALRTLSVLSALSVLSCGEGGVECVSDSACDEGLVCVSARCVGPTLAPNAESWAVYRDEMHLRLAADCGVCHGVRGEGLSAGRFDPTNLDPNLLGGVGEVDQDPNQDPIALVDPNAPPRDSKALVALPVAPGDSGWRIYLDNLTEERLWASYLDTLQFINPTDPTRSLLLSYARGELALNTGSPSAGAAEAHPVVYPVHNETPQVSCSAPFDGLAPLNFRDPLTPDATPLPPPSPAQVSHERLLSWAALDHSARGGLWRLSLTGYQTHMKELLSRKCGGCHVSEASEPRLEGRDAVVSGGFCFKEEPVSEADLSVWSPMIHVSAPDQSALVGFLNGEFDHPSYTLTPEDRAALNDALLRWLNTP